MGQWLMELFNPPLRDSLSIWQKAGRVGLITITLITLSIIVALGLTLLIFVYQSGRDALANVPHLANALEILFSSAAVNFIYVFVLIQLKRYDQRLMMPPVNRIEIASPPAKSGEANSFRS